MYQGTFLGVGHNITSPPAVLGTTLNLRETRLERTQILFSDRGGGAFRGTGQGLGQGGLLRKLVLLKKKLLEDKSVITVRLSY